MAGISLPKLNRRRLVIATLAIVILAGLGSMFAYTHHKSSHTKTATISQPSGKPSQTEPVVVNPNRIRLLATGDFIAHDSVNSAALQTDGSYNYLSLMSDFLPVFKDADIRFCNDPILNGGKALGIKGYPKFNSPTEFVTDMGRLGCNLVNTASNHSFDFSQANISASVDAWDKVSNTLAVAGQNRNQAEHDTVHYFTVKGIKFAFLAYTTYSNTAPQNGYGVNVFTQTFAAAQIKEAKQNSAQVIIASMRWGTEYSTGVNAEQQRDAQFLADQGVNLVLGHGSHELQTVQQLKGSGGNTTTVWYSLGNFLNTQEPAETLFSGLAVIDFDTSSRQITQMQYLPVYMHYEWTAQQAAADAISTRHNLHLYLLESATQSMVDAQQLHTTIDAQRTRMQTTLNTKGLSIPLITAAQLNN